MWSYAHKKIIKNYFKGVLCNCECVHLFTKVSITKKIYFSHRSSIKRENKGKARTLVLTLHTQKTTRFFLKGHYECEYVACV